MGSSLIKKNATTYYFQEKSFALDIKNSWPVLGSIINTIIKATLKLDLCSRDDLYQLAQWPHEGECNDTEYYAVRDFVKLIHAAECIAKNIDLALHTHQQFKTTNYGLVGLMALTSATVKDLLMMQIQYRKVIACFGYSTTYYQNGQFIYQWSPISESYQNTHFLQKLTFLSWVSMLKQLSDQKFMPTKIEFSFSKPKNLSAYTHIFGENISFDHAITKIYIEPKQLEFKLNQANDGLHTMLKTLATPILKRLNHKPTYEAKMRTALATLLPKGEGNLEYVAHLLGVSKRTLQRQLKFEQTSFGFVLEDYRKQQVEYYLRETEQSILEIALLLGYSDSNSLNVSFRNWYDMSPSAFRKQFKCSDNIFH